MYTENRIDRKRVEEQDTKTDNEIQIIQTGANNAIIIKENVTAREHCFAVLDYFLRLSMVLN